MPRTPEEWRRAIVAQELLSSPMAVRAGHQIPLPF
jgi:hypothetical protein